MRHPRIIVCALLIGVLAACSNREPSPTAVPTMGIPTLPADDPRLTTTVSPSPNAIFPDGGVSADNAEFPLPSAAPGLLPDGALMRLGMGTLDEVQVSP